MRRFLSILGVLFFCQIQLLAQTANYQLSGTIADEMGERIESASIRILNAKDSSYVAGELTNSNGYFSARLRNNFYVLRVSYLGYEDYFVDVNLNKDLSLETLKLRENTVMLSEAVVETKAIEIMVRGDTIEYNADSYKVQESSVLEDLLKKIPGVEIDENGKITVNGEEVKRIMVDGKEFFSDDPKVASKNLPAKMVDKIQVLNKKSDMALMTGFDDGNEEVVINLTVKPGMKEGAFGNALAGYGSKDRYEGSGMVNYMRDKTQVSVLGGINNTNNAGASDLSSAMFGSSGGGGRPRGLRFGGTSGITKAITGGLNFATEHTEKFRWGGDVRYTNNDNNVTSYTSREYTSPNDAGKKVSDIRGNNETHSFATNFKVEWEPDSLTKIVFRPKIEYNTNNTIELTDAFTEYEAGALNEIKNNTTEQRYTNDGNGYKFNGNLDLSRKLNNRGRVISIGLSGGYTKSERDGFDFQRTRYTHANATGNESIIDFNFFQDDKNYNWNVLMSYVEPLGRNNFLELSYNITNRNSETDKLSYRNIHLPDLTIDPEYSEMDESNTRFVKNDFINQNISLKFRSQRAKFNYFIGVGLEPSSSKTDLFIPNEINKNRPRKNYLSFAPSGQFNYFWDTRHNIRVDYTGTTTEPTTAQLYPGKFSSDGLDNTIGNPDLRPSFRNRVRVRYRRFQPEKASFMMLIANFNHISNDIINISYFNEDGGRTTSYTNMDGNMDGSMRFIFNTPLKNKNWSVNSMSYVSYGEKNTMIEELKNKAKSWTLQENIGLQFRSTIIDFALRGNIRYTNQRNSITSNNMNSTNYGGTYDFTFYVPNPLKGVPFFEHILSDLTIESDINYSANSGYSGGFNQKEWLWNASISKQVFKNKAGTIRFKMYDILREKSNISRSYDAAYIEDTMSNTLTNYFMVHFVYRFQFFKGGAKIDDMGGARGMNRGSRRPH